MRAQSQAAPAASASGDSSSFAIFAADIAGLLDRHELAWDCAAGSGQATIPLAQTFQRVLATDASSAMLDPDDAKRLWALSEELLD